MKRILFLTTIAALLAACGAADTSDLGQKRAELERLKASYKAVADSIKAVETWLTEHDSTVRRNLPVITAAPVEAGVFTHYVDVHGNVKADKAATLYALQGGRVRSVHVKAGDRVSAGQLIASVDNDIVQNQIQQAQTGLELAVTAFEKQDRLWQQRIGSEMQWLQAKSQKEQAEAGLAALREQQRLTNVTAPFAGTVDDVMARAGDLAAPGIPVARVVDLTGVQLEADVPEGYLRTVRSGAPAKVIFPSTGDTIHNASLAHVGDYIDPANRTFKVTVNVPKAEGKLRPNMLSDISIRDFHADSALAVPSRAVLQDTRGNSYVYVLDGIKADEARARKVMVARVSEYKGRISINPVTVGELKGGERIVDEGAKNVTDGLTVRIAN